MTAQTVRAHVLVSGTVQGVGFRYAMCEMAESLGLAGWVRNLADGRVEAEMEGERSMVQTALDWCRAGAPGAVVREVRRDWRAPRGDEVGFRIERTPRWL